jgi:hypothetical protein
MNGGLLFAVALASAATVLGALGFVALKGWRLAKHAGRFAGDVTRALEPTLRGADRATTRVADLAAGAQVLAENAARLQVAFARLGVLGQAASEGLGPFRRVRDYFTK